MTIAAVKSIFIGVGGSLILAFFCATFMGDGFLLNVYDLFIYMAVSGITSYLGAKLAVRYFNL